MKRTVWKHLGAWATALLFLAIVWMIAHAAVGNELLVPDFFVCLKETVRLLGTATLWRGIGSTLLRVFFAFSISFVLALIFAMIAYLLPSFGRFFAPIVGFFRSLPTLAVLLIILVWTSAAIAPVVVAFLSLFPSLYAGFFAAFTGVDKDLIEMSRVYRVPLKKRVFCLYLPSVLPLVARESAAAISFALKLVASAEVLAGTFQSLGGLMQEAKAYLQIPQLFALVSIAFLLGLLLETLGMLAARAIERRVR
ncbi:MAG: ABC transporter permease subunit [Clostridia bacterium]|nr:ABC transporter permease subunit [Clostridia bacterium]